MAHAIHTKSEGHRRKKTDYLQRDKPVQKKQLTIPKDGQ
jgi:hypothetical protein